MGHEGKIGNQYLAGYLASNNSTRCGASRRNFLQWATGVGLIGVACSVPETVSESLDSGTSTFAAPLGVELYTVRDQLPDQAEEVLGRLADIGFVEIEYQWSSVKTMIPLLKSTGLRPISVALNPSVVTGRGATGESLDEIAAQAKEIGAEYLMFPTIASDERGGLEFFRRFSDQLNQAGETANKHEVRICYHNHAFEFDTKEGQRPYDLLIERLDPQLVSFELDVFWVSVSGNDPVAILRRLEGRVPMVHLKDLAKDAEIRFNENVPPEDFTEVGNGTVDFVSVLRQAHDTGVKHYFVEQDFTPGDPVDSLRQSYNHLRSLTV